VREDAKPDRRLRQPESYLDLHVARQPLVRPQHQSGGQSGVSAPDDSRVGDPLRKQEVVAHEQEVRAT
jgi:hypothetical protein